MLPALLHLGTVWAQPSVISNHLIARACNALNFSGFILPFSIELTHAA